MFTCVCGFVTGVVCGLFGVAMFTAACDCSVLVVVSCYLLFVYLLLGLLVDWMLIALCWVCWLFGFGCVYGWLCMFVVNMFL